MEQKHEAIWIGRDTTTGQHINPIYRVWTTTVENYPTTTPQRPAVRQEATTTTGDINGRRV
eukprot:2845376-Amphidinium_carterae.1